MYLDWRTQSRRLYVIDIEADSLYPSVVHVMCWKELPSGEIGQCVGHDEVRDFFADKSDCIFVGHNILKFDAPHLVRLVGVQLDSSNCIDTLVLSTLYSPSLDRGHSLDAWGEFMGHPKIHFDQWHKLSQEMITYCHRDVEITAMLFTRLIKTLQSIEFSEGSIWLQHQLTCILEQQRISGFHFDGQRASDLLQMLRNKEDALAVEIRKVFKPKRNVVAVRQLCLKNGKPTAIYLRDVERYIIDENYAEGTYTAYEDVEFNVGSPPQRIAKLLELGWEPEEFTPKTKTGGGGNPMPFTKGKISPSLEKFLESTPTPEVALMAQWMAVNGRANMINTWLENWNDHDSCIHGKLFVADTLRFRHQSPNTANIPAVRLSKDGQVLRGDDGFWTYESRDLWTARPGRILVGTDAAGLELRMLAHFLNRPEFTKQVVEGDPHQYNADTVGISRPNAKTLIYAILYGAGPPKIAKTLGVPTREGARIRTLFLERLGIKELIEQAQCEQANGRVTLVDGSKVICPSAHSALNYKLQGSGARVMGLSAVLADRFIKKHGWDVLKVGDIHDEDQSDCDVDIADDFGQMRVNSIVAAGRRLGLNVPLDATYKKGYTWAETH